MDQLLDLGLLVMMIEGRLWFEEKAMKIVGREALRGRSLLMMDPHWSLCWLLGR
jgi:hypothetical protein